MKKHLHWLFSFAIFAPAVAFDTIEYSAASGMPEAQGWIKSGTVEAELQTENGRSYLAIDDTDASSGAAFQYRLDKPTAEELRQGFVFEVVARIEPFEGRSSHRVELSFKGGRVVMPLYSHNGKQNASLIATTAPQQVVASAADGDFHTWKIVGKPGDDGTCQASYYLDNELIADNLILQGASSHAVTFGAMTENLADRVGHVHYERITLRPLADGE
jgi:hypothetical protein